MTLSEFIAAERRKIVSDGHPHLESEVRLWCAEILAQDRSYLIMNGQKPLNEVWSPSDQARFIEIRDRRIKHEPIAYIMGRASFYGRDFAVEKGVLIPRSDSEHVVDVLMRLPFAAVETVHFMDVCTGTGCLGITAYLEWQRRGIRNVAQLTDLSPKAVEVATRNLMALARDEAISIHRTDLWPPNCLSRSQDVLLSNPPYISKREMTTLPPDVADYEPSMALVAGTDGLDFYRRILSEGLVWVKKGGYVVVEHGYDQRDSVSALYRTHGLADIQTVCDYGGHPRVTFGRVP